MAMPRGPFNCGLVACSTVACEFDASMAVTVLRLRLVTYTVPDAKPWGAADAGDELRKKANTGPSSMHASVAGESHARPATAFVGVGQKFHNELQVALRTATTRRFCARPAAVVFVDTTTAL